MVGIVLGVSWVQVDQDRSIQFLKKPMNRLVPVHRAPEVYLFEGLKRHFLDRWEPIRWKRLDPYLGS